ncbi:DUF2589 domain-containing protein [Cellulomonas sp. Leaf334]|uniref:DUF2589 domain-containing protein n=1 Tax=Cellulomonas sp. Leaf334 TaxID=1736339 RepID=UPI0006F839F6|nr:DUF2589 domain-containing protein [Cellulomonas sp. Leaf334]KQR16018.1 hypothetical protein ASF78_00815 [Cellulomonas sp. Leaf334]
MTRAVEELSQIPFSHLIGAPMKAAIEAQALAAQSTVEFIQKVGFKQPAAGAADALFTNPDQDADAGEIRNVTLEYTKLDENNTKSNFSLTVPLLSIVPIPYLRIDEMTIDFKAKLTDSIVRNTNTSFSLDTSIGGSYSAFWSPVKFDFRVNAAFKTSTSNQTSSTRDYSMEIHVRATQDDMPGGLSRILDMLESAITESKTA